MQTLTARCALHARQRPDHPAVICEGREVSYAQLHRCSNQTAHALLAEGLRRGARVAYLGRESERYFEIALGCAKSGTVLVPVNWRLTSREVDHVLRDSNAEFLFVEQAFRAAAERLRPDLPSLRGVVEMATADSADGGFLRWRTGHPDTDLDPGTGRDDAVVQMYSSGTTGLPKGVMLTHRNLVANVAQVSPFLPGGEGERAIAVLPFYHIYGLTVLLNMGLWQGVTLVTMPRFDLEGFLRLIQEQRITRAYLVPPIVLALAKHPLVDRYDLSSLVSINSGAAPLDASVEQACAQRIGCFTAQGYGLTETSPVVSATPVDEARLRPGSAGLLIPNTEACVVDPITGSQRGPGEPGEIWVRGPQNMKGYLNDPGATAAMITPEGWLRTGDIGSIDGEGYLRIVDRLKELIKYKGLQVAPAELEGLLLAHPAVQDAAVIPHPDPEAGELPKAFVVLKGPATPEELMEFVNRQVSTYKKIRLLETVDQIPRSPAGKILRRVLIERERAAVAR